MWDELGIAATRDAGLIRKAYADRLRVVNKSGDRDAFQRLRQAYERAIAYAASRPPVATPAMENMRAEAPAQPQLAAEPSPPPQKSEADLLLDRIRAALAARDIHRALSEYEHGVAQGLLPLGWQDWVLDQIMQIPVSDPAITPDVFDALMTRVGWTTEQGAWSRTRPVSQLRSAAMARRDAERWYGAQMHMACGGDGVWHLLRHTSVPHWAGALARRRACRRNARLLLEGRWQLPRLGRFAIKDLKSRIALYQMHKAWLGGKVVENNVARAKALVDFDENWGVAIRGSVLAVFVVPVLVVLAIAGYGGAAGLSLFFVGRLFRGFVRKA